MLKVVNKLIKEFQAIVLMSKADRSRFFEERVGAKKRAKISFGSENEINRLKASQKYKLNERNTLGVKASEGWIHNLNIGNIMHLNPINFDDMHISFLGESLKKRTLPELSKDIALEKLVYLIVSYFCVGTEYRFLHSKIDSAMYTMKESEMWHAKSLHICSAFLPEKSPLVNHITKSYLKHHLSRKSTEVEPEVKLKTVKEPEVRPEEEKKMPPLSRGNELKRRRFLLK